LSQPSGKTVPELINEGGRVNATLEGRRVTADLEARPITPTAFEFGNERFEQLIEKEQL
jgi:hypothetical protein